MEKNTAVITFESRGEEFPMEIIDRNGERWVTRKQFEQALGVETLRPLHHRLVERGELKKGIHFSDFRIESKRNSRGNPNTIIYSYRGIIRVSMASEGKRAVAFRDWAEDVLYEVMVTGSYTASGKKQQEEPVPPSIVPLAKELKAAVDAAKILGFRGDEAVLRANESVRRATGYDCMKFFGAEKVTEKKDREGKPPNLKIGKWSLNPVKRGRKWFYRAFRSFPGQKSPACVYIGADTSEGNVAERLKNKGFDLYA